MASLLEMLLSYTPVPATSLPPIGVALSHPTAQQEGVCGVQGGTLQARPTQRRFENGPSHHGFPAAAAPAQREPRPTARGAGLVPRRRQGTRWAAQTGTPPHSEQQRCLGSGKPLLLAPHRPSLPTSPLISSPLSPSAWPSPAPRSAASTRRTSAPRRCSHPARSSSPPGRGRPAGRTGDARPHPGPQQAGWGWGGAGAAARSCLQIPGYGEQPPSSGGPTGIQPPHTCCPSPHLHQVGQLELDQLLELAGRQRALLALLPRVGEEDGDDLLDGRLQLGQLARGHGAGAPQRPGAAGRGAERGSEAEGCPGEVMPGVHREKGTLSPSPAQGAVSLQGLSSAGLSRAPGLGAAPLLPGDQALRPDPPRPARGGGAEPFGDTAAIRSSVAKCHGGSRDRGTAGVPSAALTQRALERQWPGWGRRCGQQFPTYPPRPRAESCGQVPAPREVSYPASQEGRAQHFVPCATVLGFLLQPDGRTDTARACRRPPLLPSRAGNGPNPALGLAGADLPRHPRHGLGSAAVGMLRWGAGWDHGAVGSDAGGQSGFAPAPTGLEHPVGLEHHPDLFGGAGQVSPLKASPQGCRGSSQSMIQQRCGPRAGLYPHRVRVVTQPPADIIPINSGLCRN